MTETLTEKRRSLDMSLGECARKAGMTTVEMSRIERGVVIPTDETCAKVGSALGISTEDVKASLPSKEDADKEFQRTSDMLLALAAVSEDAKRKGLKKGNGGQGQIECPICKTSLRYSVASVNGHIWGSCSGEGCVRWMQ